MVAEEALSGYEAAQLAIDAHYPEWDTLGREDNNLRERIAPFGPYVLVNLPLDILPNESPYEFYEEGVEKLLENPIVKDWNPIIAPFSWEEDIADGWHRALAAKKLGAQSIPAWIPLKKAKKLKLPCLSQRKIPTENSSSPE